MKEKGFTLIELLVVMAIIGLLSAITLSSLGIARDRANLSRLQIEFRSFGTAMELYLFDFDGYPPDVSRNVPAGIQAYLAGGSWPIGPYTGSVYDWDNITGGDPYVQLSLRFCDILGNNCNFPNESWAAGFDSYSAVYYCFQGNCRSHPSRPVSHPGYCINC